MESPVNTEKEFDDEVYNLYLKPFIKRYEKQKFDRLYIHFLYVRWRKRWLFAIFPKKKIKLQVIINQIFSEQYPKNYFFLVIFPL